MPEGPVHKPTLNMPEGPVRKPAFKDDRGTSSQAYVYRCQREQFTSLRLQMPEGQVIHVLEFAENFTIVHQDEVSSAHWNHDRVAVHPTVCYYKCEHCNDATVTESLVFISECTDLFRSFHKH